MQFHGNKTYTYLIYANIKRSLFSVFNNVIVYIWLTNNARIIIQFNWCNNSRMKTIDISNKY